MPGIFIDAAAYGGLFVTSFVAATILPLQSEAALIGLLIADYAPWLLLLTATTGNVLGSIVNWRLGRGLQSYQHHKWFPVTAATLDRAIARYRRFGRWSLLLSWLPFIGDPLTVVAGALREPLGSFVVIVTVAKGARYAAIAAATLSWT